MNTSMLFRKRSPLVEDGLPFITGNENHEFAAKRNPGEGTASAILIRALKTTVQGEVSAGGFQSGNSVATLSKSKSSGSSQGASFDLSSGDVYIPNGDADKVTYYFGLPFILQALMSGIDAIDFLMAYYDLLKQYQVHGFGEKIKPALLRAADELYYWVRYGNLEVDPENDRLTAVNIKNSLPASTSIKAFVDSNTVPVKALNELPTLKTLIEEATGELLEDFGASGSPVAAFAGVAPVSSTPGRAFIGPQYDVLQEAALAGETILLTGPTGSGKTLCVLDYVRNERSESLFVAMEGKEGMLDMDFLGAYLPQEDNTRKWVDGPLLYALRGGNLYGEVVLFVDEINRFQSEQQNIFISLLNRKPGSILRQMGIEDPSIDMDGLYYYVQVPMTSEHVYCPCSNLAIIAACNLGSGYTVHRFDHALRRRFETAIEFDYLPLAQEKEMIVRIGLNAKQAEVMAKLAVRTREMFANGELPGCINTAHLTNWAAKIRRHKIGNDLTTIMEQAKLVWADQVCGRDLTGKINKGAKRKRLRRSSLPPKRLKGTKSVTSSLQRNGRKPDRAICSTWPICSKMSVLSVV